MGGNLDEGHRIWYNKHDEKAISTAADGLAAYARELSYDLISSVAPFYYKFSFSEIKDYYVRQY